MQRPDVRVIEDQVIKTEVRDVVGYEAELLMAKYGFSVNTAPVPTPNQPPVDNRSFEQMVRDHEEKMRQEEMARIARFKSATIANPNYHEVKYRDMDVDGNNIGLKIQISTDMGGIYR
jgi:hypothetical protein